MYERTTQCAPQSTLALIIGILLVIGRYLLVNVLFMYALSQEIIVQQTTGAEAAVTAMF